MFTLELQDLQTAKGAVRPVREAYELTRNLVRFDEQRWHGPLPDLPVLCLDDVSAIPFLVDISGVEEYQHRARLRAGTNDLFAAGTPQTAGYEAYCRDILGLGTAEFIHARAEENPLEVADACTRPGSLARIVEVARSAGGLLIHPYMGIEAVWDLARRVSQESGRAVTVIGPPPPVTWIANDKASFGELVSRVLGPDWLVETYESSEPNELVAHLVHLAQRYRRVALKRLRCASAMGNAVFESSDILEAPGETVQERVDEFLRRTEWDGAEEVQAVAWLDTDLSPSTQLWIPPDGTGAPRLDGIYEQLLEGAHGVFLGSRPSSLPPEVHRTLGTASLRVAAALQSLGYVGRCSFDFLVVGEPRGDFSVHFTECNGRWGGTSTPMSLLDRLFPRGRPPYRAQDFVRPGLIGASFELVLSSVADDLFDAASGRGCFVFYNVGPLEQSGKLDVIALGRTQEEAEDLVEDRLPALLGV